MIKFLLSFFLILILLSKKIFFFGIETEYATSFLGILDIISIIAMLIGGTYFFCKDYLKQKSLSVKDKPRFKKFDIGILVMLVGITTIIGMSYRINVNKTSVHWDAIALYDARARFLNSGIKFSEMPKLSDNDDKNSYYYLLYPPYTSIGHYFWQNSVGTKDIPVSVYYTIFLGILTLVITFFTKKHLGLRLSLFLALLTISNISVFKVSIKEYTNLPYTLHIVGGTFLLYLFLKNNKTWELMMGTLLISSSIWIRFLEPVWLVVAISLFLSTLIKKQELSKKILSFILIISFSSIQYFSWTYFAQTIGGNAGFLDISYVSLIEPLLGVLTGSWFPVLAVFIGSWGIPIFVYLFTLAAVYVRKVDIRKDPGLLFLSLIIVFSICMYYSQLYFVSFQTEWWEAAAKSLDRSSTFLVPIAGFILLEFLKLRGYSRKHS